MATSSSNQSLPVPIFYGENYDFWSVKMKTYFLSQDLWDVIESGVTLTEATATTPEKKKELKKMKLDDHKALYTLQMAVDDTIFPRIMGATTAKEAWVTLKNEFQGNEKVRTVKLQSLRRDLENIKMKDAEVAKDYYSRVKEIVNQMQSYGENIGDKKLVEKILISLTDKYDPIVTAIEESKDIATLSVTELMGSLEAYEQRLNRRHEKEIESAFQSKVNLKGEKCSAKNDGNENFRKGEESNREARWKKEYQPCRICKKTNHLEEDCWFDESKPQCYNCRRHGHLSRDCHFNKKFKANFHEAKEEEEHMFYAQTATEEKNEAWYIDSGCSNHMTGDESIFRNIDTSIKSLIRLGNGDLVEAKGKGTISIQTRKGARLIKDVFLVPNLKANLLSVGQMVENGYALYFDNGFCFIYDKKNRHQVIAKVKIKDRNFPIYWSYVHEAAMRAEVGYHSQMHSVKPKQNQKPKKPYEGHKHRTTIPSYKKVWREKSTTSTIETCGFAVLSKGYNKQMKCNSKIAAALLEGKEHALRRSVGVNAYSRINWLVKQ